MKKLSLFIAVVLLISCLCSCKSKTDIKDSPSDTPVTENLQTDAGKNDEKNEVQDGEQNLEMDELPEILEDDPGYLDPSKKLVVFLDIEGKDIQPGPDYFYSDSEYLYYFDVCIAQYMTVSVWGELPTSIFSALASGEINIGDLEIATDYKIYREEIVTVPISSLLFDIFYIEDGVLLGSADLTDENGKTANHNIIVYSFQAADYTPGQQIVISYTADQLVACEEEYIYEVVVDTPPSQSNKEDNTDGENTPEEDNSSENNTNEDNPDEGNTDEGNTDEGNVGEGDTNEDNTNEGNSGEGDNNETEENKTYIEKRSFFATYKLVEVVLQGGEAE